LKEAKHIAGYRMTRRKLGPRPAAAAGVATLPSIFHNMAQMDEAFRPAVSFAAQNPVESFHHSVNSKVQGHFPFRALYPRTSRMQNRVAGQEKF